MLNWFMDPETHADEYDELMALLDGEDEDPSPLAETTVTLEGPELWE